MSDHEQKHICTPLRHNLLLHDDILVDNGLGDLEGFDIQEINVSTFGPEQQVFLRGFQAQGRDALQPGSKDTGWIKLGRN